MSTVCEPLVKIRRKCCPYEQCPYERDIHQLVLYVYQAETVWILVATKSLVDKFFVQAPRTMFNVNDQNSRTLSSLCIRPSLAHPAYNKHQSVILYLIFGLKQCMSCPNCGSHFMLQHQLYYIIMELIHMKIRIVKPYILDDFITKY